jgi:N-acetylmuramoyl-L-alanine amidase
MYQYKTYFLFLFLVVMAIFSSTQTIFAQNQPFTVVIDPGHGGRDPGAVGANSQEKNIVLAVGLKLGELIKQNYPDVRVIYTRDTDRFVELRQRAGIANRANADLFISIHCNALDRRRASPQGVETFVLGLHRSEDNLAVAKKENSVILLEEDYSITYAGFDPNEPESYIMFEFLANEHLDQSIYFATYVQNQLVNNASRTNRGVRQAGFLVLREVAMPSVLVELGYISNLADERFMMSAAGQASLANAIYQGFKQYKTSIDRRTVLPGNAAQRQMQAAPATISVDTTMLIPTTATTEPALQGVREFRIQILSDSRFHQEGAAVFKGLSSVGFYRDGTMYRYTYGSTSSREEINRLLPTVRAKFRDAFIIELVDGQRVR